MISIMFVAAFGDENKVVEICQPNGGGGHNYSIMVDNCYWGKILYQIGGWRVSFQNPHDEFSGGDLQPLIDLVKGED
ncbi:hypothetical protein [Pedobacter sp. MC2016-05]|uniref:hypothetical protein n=1 Tax=Pedobacter sp. MC2016-05 TaxID=2994474 RepID=UPI0022466B6A|nr:hypothetical protein [Pedobacter sp. MC2016-05]